MRFFTDVLRALVRIIALPFFVLGAMTLVFAVMVFVTPGLSGLPLGQVWFRNDPFQFLQMGPSIQLAQVFFERKLMIPQIWSPGITTLLNIQAGIALLLTAAVSFFIAWLLFFFTRRR